MKITFAPVSEKEIEALLSEDERLNDLFADDSAMEYDGFERSKEDVVLYFYGEDADKMTALILPQLGSLPRCDRAVVLKRYGGPGAREETAKLK